MHQVKRYHDICAGHRVHGHESKCSHMHGHNYRIQFVVQAKTVNMQNSELDELGRVVDFSVVKDKLCMWVENNWDHKFLAWTEDTFMQAINETLCCHGEHNGADMFRGSIVWVPFNPTAENMAAYLVECVGPEVLPSNLELVEVTIEETAKCHVTYKKEIF